MQYAHSYKISITYNNEFSLDNSKGKYQKEVRVSYV